MGTRTVSQTINLQTPSQLERYITEIDSNGIKVHQASNYINNYCKIDTMGLELINNNKSVAQFGQIIRLGNNTGETNDYITINTDGFNIYKNNSSVARFSSNGIFIGDRNSFHIEITGGENGELGFYRDSENKIAFMNQDKLNITKTVVLQQMDVGTSMSNGEGGQWSWKIHQNSDGINNLYLKWLG